MTSPGRCTQPFLQRAIEQATYLTRSYAVVVANPPYMGSKQMNALLSQFMKASSTQTRSPTCSPALSSAAPISAGTRGAVAMITMQSWMFLSLYEKLRASPFKSANHLDAAPWCSRLRLIKQVVSATAFVLANVPPESRGSARKRDGTFIRLVDGTSEAEIVALSTALEVRPRMRASTLRRTPISWPFPPPDRLFRLSEKMRAAFDFGRPMSERDWCSEGPVCTVATSIGSHASGLK